MIVKTTAELMKFFSITKEFVFEGFKPYLDAALEPHLIFYLSKDQYAPLDAAYNANNMTSAQSNLLPYAQAVIVYQAMYEYSFVGDKTIGNNGITTNTGDDGKMAAQWRIEDLRDSCLRLHGLAVDNMLKFLESNKATYTLWALSSAYTIFKECIISTTDEFHSYQNINNSRRTYMAMRSAMKRVEELTIGNYTGTALLAQIKNQVKAGTISSENEKLLKFIRPAICALTIARSIPELVFELTADGLVVKTTSSTLTLNLKSQPLPSMLAIKLSQAQEDGATYLGKLKDYLQAHHEDYPLYEADTTVYNGSGTIDVNRKDSSTYLF